MSLQFIFIFLPHWNLQASVKLNNYKPTLSFPKTLEQLLKSLNKKIQAFMKRVPTQDCLRKSFNTHLRKMLTRRLRPKQNSLRDFSTVPFLYKPNHLQKKRGSNGGCNLTVFASIPNVFPMRRLAECFSKAGLSRRRAKQGALLLRLANSHWLNHLKHNLF